MCILKITIFHDRSHAVCIRWQMSCPPERWQKLRDWPVGERRQAAPQRSCSSAAGLDWVTPGCSRKLAYSRHRNWDYLAPLGRRRCPVISWCGRVWGDVTMPSAALGSSPLFPEVLQISSKDLFKTKGFHSEKAKWESICGLKRWCLGLAYPQSLCFNVLCFYCSEKEKLCAMVRCVQSFGKENKLYAVMFSYLVVKVGASGF